MSNIKFLGIGEEGYCDMCGRELKETYHFIVDGNSVIVGSSCARKVNQTFTVKKMKDIVSVSDRLKHEENFVSNFKLEVFDFMSIEDREYSKNSQLTQLKESKELIEKLKRELCFDM